MKMGLMMIFKVGLLLLKFILFIIFINVHLINYSKRLPIILPLILSIAFFTLLERKVLAASQGVRGLM